jgi:hypothetical protein
LPRRFSKGDSRCRGAKGRAEIRASSGETAGHFPSTDPCWSKADAGSRGKSNHGSHACHATAVHAGWRANCSKGHLERTARGNDIRGPTDFGARGGKATVRRLLAVADRRDRVPKRGGELSGWLRAEGSRNLVNPSRKKTNANDNAFALAA